MLAVWRAVFAVLCFSVCVNAQTRTLAVYHSPATPMDSAIAHEFQQEVQRLLAPAGIDVVWRKTEEANSGDALEKVTVASFDGPCSAAELPSLPQSHRGTAVLADTVVSKQSQVEPFFRVDCAEVIGRLRPALDHLNVPMRNAIFGRALGRVIAHELYHILARTMDHAHTGVAKASFSTQDLLAERFDFDPLSIVRLHPIPLYSAVE